MISYRIDTESLFYIKNWTEQLNMNCMPKFYTGLIGVMAFLGAFLSCFFIPALGDKFGRCTVWYVCICCQLPLFIGANLTENIGVIYVMCFYLGMGLIGKITCGFVLCSELNITKNKTAAGTCLMIGDVIATLYITFFIRYIS